MELRDAMRSFILEIIMKDFYGKDDGDFIRVPVAAVSQFGKAEKKGAFAFPGSTLRYVSREPLKLRDI